MTKIRYIAFSLSLLICAHISSMAQTIPSSRTTDWSHAGLNGTSFNPTHEINFIEYGGIADGETPNEQILTNLFAGLTQPALIYFPAGSYLFESPINIPDNTILQGASSDSTTFIFDLQQEDDLVKIEGSQTNILSVLSQDGELNDSSILVSNPNDFGAGDFIKIIDDDGDLVTSSWALGTTGQIIQVDSISGSQLFINSKLRRRFSVSKNAKAIKLDMIENVGIENIRIENLNSTTQQTSNIAFEYATACWLKCVESYKCNFAHVNVSNSSHIEVTGSYFHDAFSFGNGGKAYGTMIQFSSSECLVYNNIFETLRHSMILQAGANGNVIAYNYSADPKWTGTSFPSDAAGDLVLHGNYPYANLLEGNTVQNIVVDDSHGENGKFNTFFRNRVLLYGIVTAYTIPTDSLNFVGNEITNSGASYGLYMLLGNGHFTYGNNLKGTIYPTGTNNLAENSLYLDSVPSFYNSTSNWPPLGPPNQLNGYNTEAQLRYSNSQHTACSNPVDTSNDISSGIADGTKLDISIYPNPFHHVVTIHIQSTEYESGKLTILNANGQLVYEQAIRDNDLIRIYDIKEPGIYFAQIIIKDKIEVFKMVKH